MARRKLTEEEKKAKYREERLQSDYNEIIRRMHLIPEPTYTFNVGDKVKIGNLLDVTILESFENNKFYKISYSVKHENYGHPYIEEGLMTYREWFNLRPLNSTTDSLIQNDNIRLYFMSTHIGSLFSKCYHFGTDMNPDYQRDYVWDIDDKVKLIDSIFNNVDIGKFCFVHRGYNEDYMYEIVDGKQRMRAILDFYENRFPYKGKYFNDLCALDKSWFENFSISIAEIDQANKKDVLKYFLLLNKTGKRMDEKHIEKIEKLYESL